VELHEYEESLRELPCVVCGLVGVYLHHPYGGSMSERGVYKSSNSKVSDWLQIPLCYNHHQGQEGIHTIGIHAWEVLYGEQSGFVDRVGGYYGISPWSRANDERHAVKKYKAPSKILPRR